MPHVIEPPLHLLSQDYILRHADTENNSSECANPLCKTSKDSTRRRKAAQKCIERLCKECCEQAFSMALTNKLSRGRCTAHKHHEIFGAPLSSQPLHPPQPIFTPVPNLSTSTRLLEPTLVPTQRIINARDDDQPQAGPSMLSFPPSVSSQTVSQPPPLTRPVSTQPTSSQSHSRRKSLSRPIGPQWMSAAHEARKDAVVTKSVKQKRLEMKEKDRRMVSLVIYLEVSSTISSHFSLLRLHLQPLLRKELNQFA